MYKFVQLGVDQEYQIEYFENFIDKNDRISYCLSPTMKFSRFKRSLFKLCINGFHSIKLPFIKLFKKAFIDKKFKKNIKYDDYVCFIINRFDDDIIRTGTLDYLKEKYKNSKFVYYFFDKVSLRLAKDEKFFLKYSKYIDLFVSYNPIDCEKYEMLHCPDRIFKSNLCNINYYEYDVFFIGKNKNRLDKIHYVFNYLTKMGLKCLFYVVDVDSSEKKYANIIYNQRLSYKEVIDFTKKSRCILDLTQEGSNGLSLRICEAISFNKMIITDNLSVKDSVYYNSEKVIFFDNLEKEIDKLRLKSDSNWNNISKYNEYYFYDWLEERIINQIEED